MKNTEEEAPEEPKKRWIGGEVDTSLYKELKAIAEADDVPLTIIYRWALKDFVAGRKTA